MAGHARYTALLDACVLFPVAVCDSLMSVAATGLYAPKWTQRIEDEWTRSLEKKSGRPSGSYNVRRDAMRDAAPDWEVPEPAWRRIAPCLQLPDPDDVHVLAAAIAGHADCIVTANVENSARLAQIEIDGGNKAEHAQIMRDSLLALAQAI